MDSSYTISPSLWEEQKSIVMNLLDKMNVSPSGTHLSVMSFSTDVEFPIPFNGYKDIDDLKRKVTQLSYHTGWSRTDLGLTAVKERMFDKRFGARDVGLVPRALLLFTNDKTDGKIFQVVPNANYSGLLTQFPSSPFIELGSHDGRGIFLLLRRFCSLCLHNIS